MVATPATGGCSACWQGLGAGVACLGAASGSLGATAAASQPIADVSPSCRLWQLSTEFTPGSSSHTVVRAPFHVTIAFVVICAAANNMERAHVHCTFCS